jgi:leader peptidase (prepilin peptidase) / N-methyltransferase
MLNASAGATVVMGALVAALGESAAAIHDIARGALVAFVVISAVTDIETGYVFDIVSLASAISLMILNLAQGTAASSLSGACLAAAPFLLIWTVTRGRGIGFGDVKLAVVAGLGVGASTACVCVGASFVVGALWSVAALLFGRVRFGQPVAFAPFVAAGVAIVLLVPGSEAWLTG